MTRMELISLIKLLRRQGVTIYRTPELELVLAEKTQPRAYKEATKQDIGTPQYSDEQMLMWSSAGIPEEAAE